MQRTCGCHNDSPAMMMRLKNDYNRLRVVDDGKNIQIGIVYHICFNNYIKSEIEKDIEYSIKLLNEDFNKLNTNFDSGRNIYTNTKYKDIYDQYVSISNSCNITFYKVNTVYKPINPQSSTNTDILDTNIKKVSPPISPSTYLNIWVVELGGGLLGYAQFPWSNSPQTDGVVIDKGTFGRNPEYDDYNLNKTSTHEIGHWLGLYHTFQQTFNYDGGSIDYRDGTIEEEIQEKKGDCVVDTPPQAAPTFGDPYANPNSWPTSKMTDESKSYHHMFMNFMDYANDRVSFMFTKDQSSKIRQMIHIYRPAILSTIPPVNNTPVNNTPVNNPPTTNPPTTNPPTNTPVNIPPEPIINAIYNFETNNPVGWDNQLVITNAGLLGQNAQITNRNPSSGTKCFRSMVNGKGELQIKLKNIISSVTLRIKVLASNSNTVIILTPPGSNVNYTYKFPILSSYKQYTIILPKPYNSVTNGNYSIQFGTSGLSTAYSYFDDILVTNNNISNKESRIDQTRMIMKFI